MATLLVHSAAGEAEPAAARGEIGLLGLDTRYTGQIHFEGTLTVDGAVEGDVLSPEGSGATLIVNRHASIRGDVVADSVLISGQVTGTLKAKERVEIFSTGRLTGDVHTGDIMVEAGAEFQGFCHMLRPQPPLRPEGGADGAPAGRANGSGQARTRGSKGPTAHS